MLTITMDATQVNAKLDHVAGGIENMTVPFIKAGEDLVAYFAIRVFDQGGQAGSQWRALSPATLFMRAKHYGYYNRASVAEDKTLVWTGNLRAGFHKEVTSDSLRIYNDVPYFASHQLGEGVPKRQMLVVDKTVTQLIVDRLNKYISELV